MLRFDWSEGPNLSLLRQTDVAQHAYLWAGIKRGGEAWSSLLSDDITVSVTVEYGFWGQGPTIGYANPRTVSLPFGGGVVRATSANAKARGVAVAETGQPDIYVALSSAHGWDNDPSDGVPDGAYSLPGVTAHELGHGLGFISAGRGGGYLLDRYLYPLGGGDNGRYLSGDGGATGQGRIVDGTHWRDGLGLGLMDSISLQGAAAISTPSRNDVDALALIGYDPVNARAAALEPGTFLLLLFAAACVCGLRLSRRVRSNGE